MKAYEKNDDDEYFNHNQISLPPEEKRISLGHDGTDDACSGRDVGSRSIIDRRRSCGEDRIEFKICSEGAIASVVGQDRERSDNRNEEYRDEREEASDPSR